LTMSETTRRTWIALGPTETLFAAAYPVGVLLALPFVDERDTWEALGAFLWLLLAGALAVAVGIPLAVHTVGRYTARFTEEWSTMRASVAHLVVGLGMGALAAALLVLLGSVPMPAAALALVLPSGVAALGTYLLMPLALRHQWIRIAAWVLGGGPVALALALWPAAIFGYS